MADVSLLSGISRLSFDSLFPSPHVFLIFYPALLACHFSAGWRAEWGGEIWSESVAGRGGGWWEGVGGRRSESVVGNRVVADPGGDDHTPQQARDSTLRETVSASDTLTPLSAPGKHLTPGVCMAVTGGSCHKYNFCRDKHVFVSTKTRLLSRQKFCRYQPYKRPVLSRQIYVCCDRYLS